MRRADFTGAYGERMYLLFMAIRPEALPTDAAALTEMVLALDAENEKLRVAMQTLKEMIFGKRSERLAVIVAEQLALELDDLAIGVTPPAPANDDTPATKLPASPRKKARRNIRALPKHPPRCEQVLEPDTTACPCREPRLHRWRGAGEGAAATDRERHGFDGAREPRGGVEVCLVSAAVSAGADPGRSGRPSRSCDARRLGEACRMVAQEPL